MQHINDCLDFDIDTPDNEEIRRRFANEFMNSAHQKERALKPFNPVSKNQKKRARKAARKARKVTSKA